jgi:cytochrome b561
MPMVVLHWVGGAMVVGLLVMGTVVAGLPDGDAARLWPGRLHSAGGMVLGGLMVVRLVLKLKGPRPEPLALPPLHRTGVDAVHVLLYAGVLAMVASGMFLAFSSGWSDFVQGGAATPPKLAGLQARDAHELLKWPLLGLVAAHVGGVLVQQVRRGDSLRRMLPFLR